MRRMITFQKLESSARKVFRGLLTNNPATTWNAWRERRRKREFVFCLEPGSLVSLLGGVCAMDQTGNVISLVWTERLETRVERILCVEGWGEVPGP